AETGYESLLEEFAERVAGLHTAPTATDAPFLIEEDEPGIFFVAGRRALEYIAAGDVYQTNLSRGWIGTATRPVDPVWIYQRLRASNPSPFAALLRHEDFALLSSSPERLL